MTRLAPHDIARLGIGLVPENRRIFPGLTVRENLELGLSASANRSGALRRQRLEEVFQHFPRLRERYAAIDHAAAREVVAWLDDYWRVSHDMFEEA